MEDLMDYLGKTSKRMEGKCNGHVEATVGIDCKSSQQQVIELDWDNVVDSGLLSDENVHEYLREMNQIPSSESGKPLKDWSDSDLMVYLAFHQIPQDVVLALFGKQIGGNYFVNYEGIEQDILTQNLVGECSIDKEHAMKIVQLVGKLAKKQVQ